MAKNYINEWGRAKDFLKAVKDNLNLNDIKTSANREYFAIERAVVCALMIENRKISKNHKKIWEMSKSLDIGFDAFNLMRKLYDLRLQADYGKISNITELNKDNVVYYLKQLELIMKKIKEKYKLE